VNLRLTCYRTVRPNLDLPVALHREAVAGTKVVLKEHVVVLAAALAAVWLLVEDVNFTSPTFVPILFSLFVCKLVVSRMLTLDVLASLHRRLARSEGSIPWRW
jgi:hypothetical protein